MTLRLEGNKIRVSGELNFRTIPVLFREAPVRFKTLSELHLDFSDVTSTNSAAVALLVEWVKYAKKRNKLIRFYNLPSQLLSITRACGVDKIIDYNNSSAHNR